MRKLIFTLVTLLVLLLSAEVGVTLLSQRGMEKALRAQYELPSSIKVKINSFPYLLSLARNHMAEIQLEWRSELQYFADEGTLDSIDYEGRVNIYDVELNMPSLLGGRLEIRNISRQKAKMLIDIGELGRALGLPEGVLIVEKDTLYRDIDGRKTQCKVKVTSENTLNIEPYNDFMLSKGSYSNPDPVVETIRFHALPMDAILLNASINSERVVVEISIPMWEGYLQFLK